MQLDHQHFFHFRITISRLINSPSVLIFLMYPSSEFKTWLSDKPHNISKEVYGDMFFYRLVSSFSLDGRSMENHTDAVLGDLSISHVG